jgi:hypothetical protein
MEAATVCARRLGYVHKSTELLVLITNVSSVKECYNANNDGWMDGFGVRVCMKAVHKNNGSIFLPGWIVGTHPLILLLLFYVNTSGLKKHQGHFLALVHFIGVPSSCFFPKHQVKKWP